MEVDSLRPKEIFDHFDKDGDGDLNFKEFQELLKAVGERVSLTESRHLIGVIDKDRDGVISFNEFLNWYREFTPQSQKAHEERVAVIRLKLHSEILMQSIIPPSYYRLNNNEALQNENYKIDFGFEIGSIGTPTSTISLQYEENAQKAMSLKEHSTIYEIVVGTLTFVCINTPENEILLRETAEVINTSPLLSLLNVPLSSIKAAVALEGDQLLFRISGALDAEKGMMAQGVIQGIGLSEFRLKFENDHSETTDPNTSSSSKFSTVLEISTACVEMLAEFFGGKLPPTILYTLSWFKNGAIYFKFCNIEEAIKHKAFEDLVKGFGRYAMHLLDTAKTTSNPGALIRKAIELLLAKYLKPELEDLYTKISSVCQYLSKFEVAIGDYLFTSTFDVANLFKTETTTTNE